MSADTGFRCSNWGWGGNSVTVGRLGDTQQLRNSPSRQSLRVRDITAHFQFDFFLATLIPFELSIEPLKASGPQQRLAKGVRDVFDTLFKFARMLLLSFARLVG